RRRDRMAAEKKRRIVSSLAAILERRGTWFSRGHANECEVPLANIFLNSRSQPALSQWDGQNAPPKPVVQQRPRLRTRGIVDRQSENWRSRRPASRNCLIKNGLERIQDRQRIIGNLANETSRVSLTCSTRT